MAFPEHLVENIVTAMISGGGTAVSAILALFKDAKRRLDEVEKKVGSIENKTGLAWNVHQLEINFGSVQSWSNHPPEWLISLITRIARRSPSFTDSSEYAEFDQLNLRKVERRIAELEERVDKLDRKLSQCVSSDDFDKADRERAEEVAAVRTMIAETNGLLRGIQMGRSGR